MLLSILCRYADLRLRIKAEICCGDWVSARGSC